jgi:Flp pilus assembly protein protease CpaA
LPAFILAVALAGGGIALVSLVARAAFRGRPKPDWRIFKGDLPYGTAIALGGVAIFHRLPLVAPLIASVGNG